MTHDCDPEFHLPPNPEDCIPLTETELEQQLKQAGKQPLWSPDDELTDVPF